MSSGEPLSISRLMNLCVECAQTYNSQRVTVASHVDQFIVEHELTSPEDEIGTTTLREIMYGVERHKKLIHLTVEGLYAKYVASIARSDRSLYEIFTLLSIYKIKELGFPEFRHYVLSQEPHKMYCLLSFLYTPEMLPWLKDQWSTVYDHIYVQDTLLKDMSDVQSDMTALINELHLTISHATAAAIASVNQPDNLPKVQKKENTIPEPFALTQPKVKMLPRPPIQMDAVYKASPLPAPSPSLQDLEVEALARRRATDEATNKKHAGAKAPKLSTDQRAGMTHTASEKLRLELEAKERAIAEKIKINPAPVFKEVAPPKLTTAVILREDMLHKRRLEEKAAELAKFESELRDENEFHAWQLKMEAEDNAKKALEVQQRKEQAQLAAVQAIQAMAQAAEEKHKIVLEVREDLRLINIKKEKAKKKEIIKKQAQVKQVVADKQLIPIAIHAVIEKKQQAAEEIAAMKIEAEKIKKKEREVELKKKKQLIHEIQAMEKLASVRAKKPKEIDPTTTGGLGFLDEMSLVELQSRLTFLAEREALFLEEKRRKILEEKAKKAAVLEEIQRNVGRMRKEMKAEFQEKKVEKTLVAVAEKEKIKEKHSLEAEILKTHLASAAESKRIEALRLVKELKAKKIQNAFYNQAKLAQQLEREEDLARAEKRIQATSAAVKEEQEKLRQIEIYTQEKNRLKLEKIKKREKESIRLKADQLLEQHRIEDIELKEEDIALKKIQYKEIKKEVDAQMIQHRNINPYAKQIADREARRAARLSATLQPTGTITMKRSSQQHEDGGDEFAASRSMAERELRQQIEALSIADEPVGSDGEEEEKTQPAPVVPTTSAVDAVKQSEANLASITQKRGAMGSKRIPSVSTSKAATLRATKTKQQLELQA